MCTALHAAREVDGDGTPGSRFVETTRETGNGKRQARSEKREREARDGETENGEEKGKGKHRNGENEGTGKPQGREKRTYVPLCSTLRVFL